MTKLALVKVVVNGIVGASTTYTVASVIKNNTNPETTAQKAEIAIGAFVIGGVVAKHTKNYSNDLIDDIADSFRNLKSTFHKES